MSHPDRPRPVPGPPRAPVVPPPVPADRATGAPAVPAAPADDTAPAPAPGSRFADLAERPVAEHVGVYEAEHERLQRELSTIDQL
ncbi:hypothetical protein [Modestobacter sp. SYSU DS0290]